MGKKVLKIGLIFLLIGVAVIFTFSTILAFVAPQFMAKTFESMNMKSLAYGCYDRQFRNSNQVDQQYVMFTKATEISFNSHIVYYGERLMNNENYNVFLVNVNLENAKKTENYISNNQDLSENEKTRLQIISRNEDNFITCSYVKALLNLGKTDKAKDFLINQINNIISEKRFGENTSFAAGVYVQNEKTLPEDLLLKTEQFFDEFEKSLTIDQEKIEISDKVCFQRLTETASCLSTHYKNSSNAEKANYWLAKAQSYLNLIYEK